MDKLSVRRSQVDSLPSRASLSSPLTKPIASSGVYLAEHASSVSVTDISISGYGHEVLRIAQQKVRCLYPKLKSFVDLAFGEFSVQTGLTLPYWPLPSLR